jgi:hypothetical protein
MWRYNVSDKVSIRVHIIHVWNFNEKCFQEFLLTRNESSDGNKCSWPPISVGSCIFSKCICLTLWLACHSSTKEGNVWRFTSIPAHTLMHLINGGELHPIHQLTLYCFVHTCTHLCFMYLLFCLSTVGHLDYLAHLSWHQCFPMITFSKFLLLLNGFRFVLHRMYDLYL